MNGIFEDKDVVNKGQRESWKKSERDLALNECFEGAANHEEIGVKYKGGRRAFYKSIYEKLKYNIKGRAERYRPTKFRRSRQGARWTPIEMEFLRAHRERNIPNEVTARILMRLPKELGIQLEEWYRNASATLVAEDLLQAHQYLYHCRRSSVVTDDQYDEMKEKLGRYRNRSLPPRTRTVDYDSHLRDLGQYLWVKHLEERGIREKRMDEK